MKATRLAGLHYWSVYQPDRRIDFNGIFWSRPEGGVLIDPLPLSDEQAARVSELGGARFVLATNADHLRASVELKERFGAELLAPEVDRERFAEPAAVDRWFTDEAGLPEGIECGILEGGKSPGEPWLFLEPLRAAYFSDLVRSHVSGELCLLPPAKLSDPARVRESLAAVSRTLAPREIEAVLLGDGDLLLHDARSVLTRFLAAQLA